MEHIEAFINLKDAAGRISDGINAVGLMAMGLSMARDPYADGFNAVWNYLTDAEWDFQEQITACMDTK